MIVLEIWIFFSFGNYYTICTKRFVEITFSMPIVYIPLLIIVGFNYFALDYKNNWKKYNVEFANYSKRKNRIGGWIVFGIILLIISNLIYSFYLMSEVDWSKYR